MRLRLFSFTTVLVVVLFTGCAQKNNDRDYVVTIQTSYGNMVAVLFDETPKHKENFIKLAKEKFFDSLLFHRVIPDFMIQGGDPLSKNAQPGEHLGTGGPGYTVDAEFNPKFFHERGALSAARLGDQQNPTKASSGSQFYVVQGRKYQEAELTQLEQSIVYNRKNNALRTCLSMPEYAAVRQQVLDKQREGNTDWLNSFFVQSDTLIKKVMPDYKAFSFTPEARARYQEAGGAPHLDGDYTVFGKVIFGLDVIDKIAALPRDGADRPSEDLRMVVTVKEMTKAQIEKEFGYKYPTE